MKRGCQLTQIPWLVQLVILLSTPCFTLIFSACEISEAYFSYLKVLWEASTRGSTFRSWKHRHDIPQCHWIAVTPRYFCKALVMAFILKRQGSLGSYWKVPLSTIKFKCKQTNNVTSWGPEECQHEPWWALIATFGVAWPVIFSWMLRNTLPQSPSLPLSHIVTWTPWSFSSWDSVSLYHKLDCHLMSSIFLLV